MQSYKFAAVQDSTHIGQIVIDIDDDIANLVAQINEGPEVISTDLASSFKDVVLDAILGPFGLSSAAFDDQDGGSVTTLKNFEEGCASKRDQERLANLQAARSGPIDRHGSSPEQSYDTKIKRERKEHFKSEKPIMDEYRPGVELPRDGRAQRDHVVSAAEIERAAKAQLGQSRERRVEVGTSDENLAWTHGSANASKKDHEGMGWLDKKKVRDGKSITNEEHFEIDRNAFKEIDERARKKIDREQSRDLMKKQSKELLLDGGIEAATLGGRQLIGLILKDVAESLIDEVRILLKRGFVSVKALLRSLKFRCIEIGRKLLRKWRTYLEQTGLSLLTGFFSKVVTFLINNVIKTLKNVVVLIRESSLAVIRSMHLVLFPPAGMSGSEIAAQALSLLAGGAVAAGTILLQECNDPAVFAQVRPLKHRLRRVSSCPAPGVGVGGCRTGSSRQSHDWRVAGFRSGGDARTAPSRCGSPARSSRSAAGSAG